MTFAIDDKTSLTSTIYSDRMMVSRSNVLKRLDVKDIPARLSYRLDLVKPTVSDFPTSVNPDTARYVNIDDGIRVNVITKAFSLSADINIWTRTLPGGSWSVTLGAVRGWSLTNQNQGGIVLRESATGKILLFGFSGTTNGGVTLTRLSGPTGSGTNLAGQIETDLGFAFFRFTKVSTTILCEYSFDGIAWAEMFSDTITSSFTTAPDQWGFWMSHNQQDITNSAIEMDILHWSE